MIDRWCIEIKGDLEDLELLKANIKNASFYISEKAGVYLIESDRFSQLENLEDVLNEGEKIVRIINGIASINLNIKDNIKIVGGVKASGVTSKILSEHKQLDYKSRVTTITDLNNPELSSNAIERWIFLAEENIAVRKVFRLLNYGLESFANAYRIYEIIDKDLKGKHKEYFGITNSEISRFTGTTNVPKYAGDLARHGHKEISKDMKEIPMTLEEISNFIAKVIFEWIHYRVDNINTNSLDSAEELTYDRWSIEIESKDKILETLTNINIQDFKYYSINNDHFIKHKRFEEHRNIEDILNDGEEIVSVLNGIGKINSNLKGNIRILGASKELKNGHKGSLKYRQEDLDVEFIVATSLNEKTRYENSVDKWIQLAETNEYTCKVFRLLNYGFSCINIWRIIELIKKDLGSKYTSILGITKNEMKRLKGSIDNPEVVGDLARHGTYDGETINNPMKLNEASFYTNDLVYRWIHHKIALLEKDE